MLESLSRRKEPKDIQEAAEYVPQIATLGGEKR
jgi:hypothetical protein